MPSSPAPSPGDLDLMRRALTLARDSVGLASPNPEVGCVLVNSSTGQILGGGAHHYDQRDHAEIVALKQAAALGHNVRGATAFVTLEPCSHHGRTGPCADALTAAGISRCVVATADPNPLVSGQGLARLRAAGVAVTLGPGETEARRLNLAFAHFIQHRRPFVTLKAALSADGYLAPPPHTRSALQPFWLTGPESRAHVHQLRHAADALLTGVGTVLADNPALTDRSGRPRRRPLLRVILDPQLRTPPSTKLLQPISPTFPPSAPDLLFLCAESAPEAREAALRAAGPHGTEIIRLPAGPAGHLSLPAVLSLLAERQCLSVLLEAGSTLNGSFLHEDLVDQVVLFFAGRDLGASSLPFAAGGPSPFLLEQSLLTPQTSLFGPDRVVQGLLHDPWPQPPGPAII